VFGREAGQSLPFTDEVKKVKAMPLLPHTSSRCAA
jgi:hypothetical protein